MPVNKADLDLKDVTIKTITSLYLYGELTRPSSSPIRSAVEYALLPKDDNSKSYLPVNIDMASYMNTGAGRYAVPSSSKLVSDFFTSDIGLEVGRRYTAAELINSRYNDDNRNLLFSYANKDIDVNSPDYAQRTYIFNNAQFSISEDAIFYIDNEGKQHIENLSVYARQDNFDYVTFGFLANVGNAVLLEVNIDPYGIGRQLQINYTNPEKVKPKDIDYTIEDFERDKAYLENVTSEYGLINAGIRMAPYVLGQLNAENIPYKLLPIDVTTGAYLPITLLHMYVFDIISKLFGASQTASPLVLDLDGDGIELSATGAAGSVYFDLDNDGFGEATGWVRGGDGLLALDRNGNGVIDNKSELFGDTGTAVNGFENLKTLDSNLDGRITASDQKFRDLRVWIDANADGISQASELRTLSSLGITAINTGYTDVNKTNAGHAVLQEGTFMRNGITRQIADVWFTADQANTEYLKDYTLDTRTLFLPTLRGYGTIADLHIAMSMDKTGAGNLMDRVMALAGKDITALFSSTAFFDDMRALLHRWAGVDGIDPASRGVNVDARDLTFLERLSGEPFLQRGYESNPRPNASKELLDAFEYALNAFAGRIAVQAAGGGLFRGQEVYDGAKDSFGTLGALDTAVLNTLGARAKTMTAANAQILWENVLRVVIGVKGEAGITVADRTQLNNAMKASHASLGFDIVRDSIFADNREGAFLSGTTGNDTINGTTRDDTIGGLAGNDTINGGLGNDTLNGGAGNDRLAGGGGDDLLLGGAGVDTYVYNRGDGSDTIREEARSALGDVILFGAGITASNLTIARVSNTDMKISVNAAGGGGEIIIENQFDNAFGAVELLRFANGTSMDLMNMNFTLQGRAEDDILHGLGGAARDTISGAGGNDTIYGYAGEDTLYGGAGNDIIYGGGPESTHFTETASNRLYGDAGDDRIYGSYGIDYIYGGRGNDYMAGSQGNDNYYFDLKGGNDTIKEISTGTDVIYMGAGITASNLSYIREGNFNLKIMVNGGFDGNILLEGQFATDSANGAVEFIELSTGQRIDLRTLNYGLFGTAANETLIGTPGAGIDTISGAGGNDTIFGYLGDDLLFGGDGDDIIHGGGETNIYYTETASNRLFGDAGNDQIYGSYGIDYIYGGLGDDTLSGRQGADKYYFRRGWGNDTIYEISNDIDSLIFDDTIALSDISYSRIGNIDLMISVNAGYGGSVLIKDQFSTHVENYTLEMLVLANGTQIDLRTIGYTLRGTSAGETLVGAYKNSNGQDIIYGEGGDDTIYGYQGNDTLYGGAGNDIIYGGDNTVNYSSETSTNRLYGDAGNDTLYGAYGADHLYGGAGNDYMAGSVGADSYYFNLNGGSDTILEIREGLDKIVFGAGISGSNISFLRSGDTDLQILINNGAGGSITIKEQYYNSVFAGEVEFLSFSNGAQIDLRTIGYTLRGTSAGETLVGAYKNSNGQDTIYGEGGDDTIYGYQGNDTLYGGAGNDIIYGGDNTVNYSSETSTNRLYGDAGNDTLYGAYGADHLYGGAGNDYMAGSAGSDSYYFYLNGGADIIEESSSGVDTIVFGAGITSSNISFLRSGDTDLQILINNGAGGSIIIQKQYYNSVFAGEVEFLSFSNGAQIDLRTLGYTLRGTSAGETLIGAYKNSNGQDIIYGEGGDDRIFGYQGNDTLYGGAGNDSLWGDTGSDILYGDDGLDNLWGGTGADTFMFLRDTAFRNIDVINDFSRAELDKINIANLLQGYNPQTHSITGFVEITTVGYDSILKVDANGGANNFVQIATIKGVAGLTDEAALVASGNLIVV